jgi:selenide,water dikinase
VKRLLLLGGGHSHLEVVRQLRLKRAHAAGIETVWASADSHTAYSGMLPGVVAGHYRPEDMQIDLAALAASAGCRFIPGSAIALDLRQRCAILADGSRIEYDVLSLNTGSVADLQAVPGAREHATSLRPFDAFLQAWLSMSIDAVSARGCRIVVVGGGAGGVEIALAMAFRLSREPSRSGRHSVALITETPKILPGYPESARKRMEVMLAKFGVALRCGNAVTKVTADTVTTSNGEAIPADRAIWATTGAAPPWLRATGVVTDARGFVAVDSCLRSTSNPEVFGGGDVVSMVTSPHPKAGVYAVRHGPVLAANLRAALAGGQLVTYAPQRRALSLLSAGDKYAVGVWGQWTAAGSWVWSWKDHIDRDFVAKYRVSPKHA